MARNYLLILVIFSFIGASVQNTSGNTIEDESNPIADAISSILKEQNGENIGAMVSNFIQEQGANFLGDAMAGLAKQSGEQVLDGLGSLLSGETESDNGGKGI